MGEHAERGDLPAGEVEGDCGILWQHGTAMREIGLRPVCEWPAGEQDLACRERAVAGQGSQERALAGAIGTYDGEEFTGSYVERDIADENLVARTDLDSDGLQRTHGIPRAARPTSSQRKNGPPTSAVRIPIGNSAGATMVRASASASTRNAPPNSAAAGNSVR